MRMTRSFRDPTTRMTANFPSPSAMDRARNFPAESKTVTTAPPIGAFVALSVSVPRTRWACAGAASTTAAAKATASALRTAPREVANAVEQTIHFLLGRVAAAADAHESIRNESKPVDDGRRI